MKPSIEYVVLSDSDIKKIADAEMERVETQIASLDFKIAVADEILSRPTPVTGINPALGEVSVEQRNAVTAQRATDVAARAHAIVLWEAMAAVFEEKPAKKKAA